MKFSDIITLIRIKIALKHNDVKKITKIVNSGKYNEDILSDDIIVKMIKVGYTASDDMPQKIKCSSKYLGLMMEMKGCRNDLIDFFDESILTPKIIENSIRKGYQLSSKSSKIISGNLEYVTMILFEFLPKKHVSHTLDFELRKVANNLKYCSKTIIYDALINFYVRDEKFGGYFLDRDMGLPLVLNEIDVDFDILKRIFTKFDELFEGLFSLELAIEGIDKKKWSDDFFDFVGSRIESVETVSDKIKQNPKFIKALIKNRKIDLTYFLETLDISCLNSQDIDELFKKKFDGRLFFDDELYYMLKQCKKENFELINWKKYILWIEPELIGCLFPSSIDSNKFLSEKGIDITEDIEEEQRQFVLDLLMNIDDSKSLSFILIFCNSQIMDKIKGEVYTIFKERNFLYSSDFSETILDNLDFFKTLIVDSTNSEVVKSVIDNCNIKLLTDDFICQAIDNGYYMSCNTPKIIRNNLGYAFRILDKAKSIKAVLSVINHVDTDILSYELIDIALDKGYYLTAETPSVIRNNLKFIKRLVYNMKKNNIVIDVNCYRDDNKVNPFKMNEKVMFKYGDTYRYKEIEVLPISDLEIDEIIKNDFSSYDEEYKDKIKVIFKTVRNVIALYYELDNLFLKEMFDFYNVNEILKMYKYLFLVNKRIDFSTILKSGQMEQFKAGYEVIYGNFDVENLYEYYQKFLINHNLICGIDFKKVSGDKILLLKKVFLSNYTDINYDKFNMEDFSQLVYNRNKDNMYDIESVRNTICLLLFNNHYKDLKDFNKNVLSYDKVISLISSIKNENIKHILKKYSVFLYFFEEKIFNNNDYIELKEIATKLNDLFLKNNKIYNYIYELFGNMKKKALILYGIELNDNLGKVNNVDKFNDVVYSKGKYVTSNVELGLNSVSVDRIDYYEDTYFLQHIMNYNPHSRKEVPITVWKNPLLVGAAYICLTLFDNNTVQYERTGYNVNNVTLLFNRIDPKNLRIIGNCDLTVRAKDNSTELEQLIPSEFMPYRENLKSYLNSDYSHTEYVFLRENEDGSILYPCGVKVVGDEPTQAEIDVAAYLGVPLIKLHKTLKKTNDQVVEINENVSELYDLSKNVEVEQLEELIECLSGKDSKFKR